MLCWITILRGVLIIMRQHDPSEALFYYFRLEDQVPGTHLLRLIEKHISFAFVREKLKASYACKFRKWQRSGNRSGKRQPCCNPLSTSVYCRLNLVAAVGLEPTTYGL